ncbi:hypothetical protein F5144DRAFT_590553 [Chaetomium tenue]|uniref:Uncharacterized protein n=1 Tax=Chaetomium tenue TaxID=1854479 RepID=A0ACB7PHA0_9PEZI|nr:hypothetical protein F5144DRAFT_590553 [Chaetomium globosum]
MEQLELTDYGLRVAEVLLIQSISDAEGTTTARFYANPSAMSLPGPKLPEYHPKSLESPPPKPREKEKEDRNEGGVGGMPSVVTREEGTPDGAEEEGRGGEPAKITYLTHRNFLGPAAVLPSAISLSKPEVSGLLARILIVVGDDTIVRALKPWMVKDREEGGEAGKIGFPKADLERFIRAHIHAHNDGLHQEEEDAGGKMPGLVSVISWWRRRVQDLPSFVVERKIADGRPWSTDDDSTPLNRTFDRYSPWPACTHRPYHLLSTSQEGGVAINAAQECISLYWAAVDGIQTVVDDGQQQRQRGKKADKERKVASQETIDNMNEEEPTPGTRLSQFVKALAQVESIPHDCPQNFVQSVIAHMCLLTDLITGIRGPAPLVALGAGVRSCIISVFVIWLPSAILLLFACWSYVSAREVVLQLLVVFTVGGLCTAEWRLADSVFIPTWAKAAVGPLIFLVPFHLVGVAKYLCYQIRKTKRSHDPKVADRALKDIGAWKIGDSGLDADVKTAARMWTIWYAPAVVYGYAMRYV